MKDIAAGVGLVGEDQVGRLAVKPSQQLVDVALAGTESMHHEIVLLCDHGSTLAGSWDCPARVELYPILRHPSPGGLLPGGGEFTIAHLGNLPSAVTLPATAPEASFPLQPKSFCLRSARQALVAG